MRKALITWFGCGQMRIASGTWGSAGALIPAALWWLVCYHAIGGASAFRLFHGVLVVGTILACVFSILWGPWAIAYFADHHNTRKDGDPGAFVLDEVAGQWLTLLFLPMSTFWPNALVIAVVQFLGFRIADIIKPWPGKWLEKFPAGWGILLDDLSSALYVNIAAQLVFRLWLGWT
jgi:phosphatidylglycerophosphatase A